MLLRVNRLDKIFKHALEQRFVGAIVHFLAFLQVKRQQLKPDEQANVVANGRLR